MINIPKNIEITQINVFYFVRKVQWRMLLSFFKNRLSFNIDVFLKAF